MIAARPALYNAHTDKLVFVCMLARCDWLNEPHPYAEPRYCPPQDMIPVAYSPHMYSNMRIVGIG
jgi:hypothetical protein